MKIKYIAHSNSSKFMYLKLRALTQEVVHEVNACTNYFGSTGNELVDCRNGLQHKIDSQPRINVGFLGTYVELELANNYLKVWHKPNTFKKLICEVIQEEVSHE